jgi:hypothetical protein
LSFTQTESIIGLFFFGVENTTRFSGVLRSANRHPIFLHKKSPLAGGSSNSEIFFRLSTIVIILPVAPPSIMLTYNWQDQPDFVQKHIIDLFMGMISCVSYGCLRQDPIEHQVLRTQ